MELDELRRKRVETKARENEERDVAKKKAQLGALCDALLRSLPTSWAPGDAGWKTSVATALVMWGNAANAIGLGDRVEHLPLRSAGSETALLLMKLAAKGATVDELLRDMPDDPEELYQFLPAACGQLIHDPWSLSDSPDVNPIRQMGSQHQQVGIVPPAFGPGEFTPATKSERLILEELEPAVRKAYMSQQLAETLCEKPRAIAR